MSSLKDKVVLITGSSSGIGRAAAHAFAEAGAKVVLAARGAERGEAVAQAIREAGGEARFIQADVSVSDDVARLVADTVTAYGRLDAKIPSSACVSARLGFSTTLSAAKCTSSASCPSPKRQLGSKISENQNEESCAV